VSIRALFLLALLPACAAPPSTPVPHRGHAHNDYLHARALHEALEQGFHSAEADVFLVDGELRVGHERALLRQGTLQSLYLEPLRHRAAANGGSVHPGGGTFTLLVDIKADSPAVYGRLCELLTEYRELLTEFRDDGITQGAVTVILSGDRPRALVAAAHERLCAIDGRPRDLDDDPSPFLVPWISDAWSNHFGRGTEELDAAQRAHLDALVARTHAQGRRLRFWGAPDRETMWALQRAAGVDMINTDRLAAFAAWARTATP
jgi:glycerophosphoryl diester phosphodiesterase